MITLAEIKLHCRIDQDSEDELLESYCAAARELIENYICRPIFDTAVPEDVDEGIVMTHGMKQAMLLIIAHWYEHRESVTEVSMNEIPLGVHALLQPYRIMGI